MMDERKYALMMVGSILATAAALTAFSFLGGRTGSSESSLAGAGVGGSGEVVPALGPRLNDGAGGGIVSDSPPVAAGSLEEAQSFRVEPGVN